MFGCVFLYVWWEGTDRGAIHLKQSLNASAIKVRTTNDELTGSFEAENVELTTTNDHIEAQITLRNDGRGDRSEALVETSNACVSLSLSRLLSSAYIRGADECGLFVRIV